MDATPFRSVVGSLAYLVSRSRLDMVFAMNYLARHSTAPTAAPWDILDHIVGYLLKTQGHGITLCPENCGGPIDMHGRVYCAIQLNTTSITGDKSTDTTGPRLQEDNLLRQPSGGAGFNQQLISKTHAVP
ncbi:hypothetical protein O181_093027 [Austropuccinia psidii MF-1]|uniref:Mitochondrial protein n=1 Tax=Austropuccinia psidii MF-1 TaxID=1389203 RepID=A0A9Q3PA53_9BASI|nr:hypothetical protein [Austropuccinia psidii MF-1]